MTFVRTLVAAAVLATTTAALAQSHSLSDAAWLAGTWRSVTAQGVTEEHWTAPSDSMMVGLSHDVQQGRTRAFEFLRLIVRDGEVFYVASPNAKKVAEFKLVEATPQRLVFEGGDAHVQRVIYRKTGPGSMVARIEGSEDGKAFAQDFTYTRTTVSQSAH